ncbi:hypothetical protein [Jidongwangia harbinensis]|uniref:hypothetical protein n=1 Tax=Jidongwangia harbinensis TaxID=2878561 RepID=UPI001CD953E4|nr:hypothetical protein [Jidongwangia harbinensis]MCA2214272.1 hypothetical protein [Jidongwangia harbinensis]
MPARYDLDPGDVRRRVAQCLAGLPATPGRFVAVPAGPGEPLADVGRTVERRVFQETFGNDAAVMTDEYRRYEAQSLFFLVLDREAVAPAGVCRAVAGTGRGIKTIDDAPAHIGHDADAIAAAHGMTGGPVWDFATLAVLPEYRGRRSSLEVSTLLYRTFLRAGRDAGVQHVVAMLDRGAYRNIELLGVPLAALAGSGPFGYLGSTDNRAVYSEFAAILPAIARQAQRLRRPFGPFAGRIRRRGLRRLLVRQMAARVAHRVATGRGVDDRIVLPRAGLPGPAVSAARARI